MSRGEVMMVGVDVIGVGLPVSEDEVIVDMEEWLGEWACLEESSEAVFGDDGLGGEELAGYAVVEDPLCQLIVHPCPEVRDVESRGGRMQYVGMKKCLFQMWLLLGRKSEITCSLIHMSGVYRARRVNEYVWIVRKLRFVPASLEEIGENNVDYPLYIRKSSRNKPVEERTVFKVIYSPYYMFVPDDMVLEQEDGIETWQIMIPLENDK